jgi:NAD+ synthase (glutamine-hydrolysing)
MIAMNGHIVAQGSQFSLNDVEVVTATIDIEDVRSHRTSRSRGLQAARSEVFHRIEVPFALSSGKFGDTDGAMALGIQAKLSGARFHTPEEEIA